MGLPVKPKFDYIHFATIDSTNSWAKRNTSLLNQNHITVITASQQTKGYGRCKRSWVSPFGNIYATLFFTLPLNYSYLINLGQILALACSHVLESKGFALQLKWPNDLLLEKKKIAGFLVEVLRSEKLEIVLGMGLNVNTNEEHLKKVDQKATSLMLFSKRTWELGSILNPILYTFYNYLRLLSSSGFTHFQPIYQKLLAFQDKEIVCQLGNQKIQGICHSINPDGTLNLQLPSGSMISLNAAEISTS
ncbi:biotin--[acetyl-CoA-carboxylase] ligase [Candidatus Rhabdochlamydia porcellionis]|jgi:BirA family transcriptional regulator, biotin operon repressor / biotin---[acetyl-CoA-carboxylase] ligase|uniref:Bifunctional ligase/repressor BirA n=1 Tax=Candidatus Rhabdochlamydia porcellionis TaxID=225148 RepID=A0ABX8Z1P1_9BACT|nr:biotin--[acetyl-CoA-carboxylase] ligase [Candidatus Rhabdochlamydia porcellionis]QZA59270.1 Bifunctional ligase/repressor BirA [Candidatus Rhabdochlamydia porcellionis]